MRATRRTLTIATTILLATSLAACGSDAEKSVPGPNFATVTGAGRDVQLPADIQRADYPDACRLLPADTVQSLLGAPATADSNAGGCAWSTGRASYPGLQVSWIELGSNAEQVYTERLGGEVEAGNRSGIGERARLYRLNDNMITRVDVLQPRAFFRVDVTSAVTAAQDLATSERIAVRVAQLVAEQVS